MLETLYAGQDDALEAQRAEQSRADLRSLIAFEVSYEVYALPILSVAEIHPPLPFMPLPFVPKHVLGLINLRGIVIPVLDLRHRFNLRIHPPSPEARMIVLKGATGQAALLVDAVYGLARVPRADFKPTPSGALRIEAAFCAQVAMISGRLVIELNVPALLADIAAHPESDSQA